MKLLCISILVFYVIQAASATGGTANSGSREVISLKEIDDANMDDFWNCLEFLNSRENNIPQSRLEEIENELLACLSNSGGDDIGTRQCQSLGKRKEFRHAFVSKFRSLLQKDQRVRIHTEMTEKDLDYFLLQIN